MEAFIVGKSIVYKDATFNLDDLMDESFYRLSNEKSADFNNDTYGVNELFEGFVQPYLALEKWLIDNCPEALDVRKADFDYKLYARDISKRRSLDVRGVRVCAFLRWPIYHLVVFSSVLYIIFRLLQIPYNPNITISKRFAVLRSKAAIKKFKNFKEISQEIESFYDKNSIYRLYPKGKRIKWAISAYIKSFSSIREIVNSYVPLLGKYFKYVLMNYYQKRIVYAEFYKLVMDDYLSHFEGMEFYTGNNIDRFSVIEDKLCKKHQIKSYNIPHGIEYGYRFPKGFSSDVFYTHSQYTADFLNNLYNTSKYIYDKSIISRMFKYNYDKPHDKMVIFFTEPRDINVNIDIIKELLSSLEKKKIKLYLKLHPVDKKENYKEFNVNYISDYELSLTGNICISRKSTILLEAIYNQSLPIAIITNPKDRTMFALFPSLNAKEIVKTYSVQELVNVIESNIYS